jgi:2-octaprenyl-6-methoxyphenol hydroxylase
LDAEIAIAGSGPVALLLALALRQADVPFTLLGAAAQPADRPIALARGSCLLLEQWNILDELGPTPINAVHVSQRGGFGRTLIRAADEGVPALGQVVSYRALVQALRRKLEPAPASRRVTGWQEDGDAVRVEWSSATGGAEDKAVQGETRAALLVLADGVPERTSGEGRSGITPEGGREYGQSAVVARVTTARPHRNTAWERFTPRGPIALLPQGNDLALIWSTGHEEACALCALDEAPFLQRLQDAFGNRAGRFLHGGPRQAFPLSLRYASRAASPRVVVIGNAAQTLHPVAGQGLNLGLRDAWELADLISSSRHPPGLLESRFARRRRLDRRGGIVFTDTLVRLFSQERRALSAARGLGLAALDLAPPARRFLARRMMFGARALP